MKIIKYLCNLLNKNFDEIAYDDNYAEIANSNIQFYKTYNYIMIGLLLMLFVSTYFSDYARSLRLVYIVFILLSIIEVTLLQKGVTNKLKYIHYTIYYGIFKSYVFCYFSSVIFNQNEYAITYFIFMILLPISFILKPIVMTEIQTIVSVIFCFLTFVFKPLNYAVGDVLACIVFYVISIVIAGHINNLRINNTRIIHLEHKRNDALEQQKEILGITLAVAKLCNVPEAEFKKNLNNVVEIVRKQYNASRAYIFEFNWENYTMSNTFESVSEGIEPMMTILQNLSTDIVSFWMEKFNNNESVLILNVELIKEDKKRQEEYKILVEQGIHSLLVAPISKNGCLYGYIGVDDPKRFVDEHPFIENVSQLLSQEFFACEQQAKLIEISRTDALTGLRNRYSYEETIKKCKKDDYGIVFADVNGLKYMNDQFGHIQGDHYILEAACGLKECFPLNDIFRISGDEFVVITPYENEIDFENDVQKLRDICSDGNKKILAIGYVYGQSVDVMSMIQQAEKNMYEDKSLYYQSNPQFDRRKE